MARGKEEQFPKLEICMPAHSRGFTVSRNPHQQNRTRSLQLWKSKSRKNILGLVHTRELNAQSTNFQRLCLEAHAAQPRFWEYGGGKARFDGSLEQVNLMVQTSNGLTHANFLIGGGSGKTLGICMTTGGNGFWGELLGPCQCFTSNPKIDEEGKTTLPKVFLKSQDTGCLGDITSIKALKRNPDLSSQRFIMTSSGQGGGGGTFQVMRLDGQDHTISTVKRFTSKDHGFWVADCNYDSTKACIGTTMGVFIFDIEDPPRARCILSKFDCLSLKYLGDIVYAGLRNGYVRAIDTRCQLFCASTVMGMGSAVCSLDILPLDDRYLLASAMNSKIRLWDLRMTARAVRKFKGHKNTHARLRMGVDPRGMLLASGGDDNTVRIWSVPSGRLLRTQRGCSCLPSLSETSLLETSRPPMTTVRWHTSYYGGRDAIRESCYEDDYAWSLWVGSFDGLFLMHGAAT